MFPYFTITSSYITEYIAVLCEYCLFSFCTTFRKTFFHLHNATMLILNAYFLNVKKVRNQGLSLPAGPTVSHDTCQRAVVPRAAFFSALFLQQCWFWSSAVPLFMYAVQGNRILYNVTYSLRIWVKGAGCRVLHTPPIYCNSVGNL